MTKKIHTEFIILVILFCERIGLFPGNYAALSFHHFIRPWDWSVRFWMALR